MPSVMLQNWRIFSRAGYYLNGQPAIVPFAGGRVSFNMEGINVQMDIEVNHLNPVANPSILDKALQTLPNPVRGNVKNNHYYQIGYVQILEYSKMEIAYRANTHTWMGQARNKTVLYYFQKA